ncbi:MAG: YeeE/YedE family protein [Acholeplasmataceae bacterium]|nr:YeeE/YedE family protein [Acholeplasmataceae bacterium]
MVEETKIKRQSSSRTRQPKINQIPFGILLLIGLIVIGLLLAGSNEKMVFFLVTGVTFGYILQRSRFCFTAACRDPHLTKSTSLTRAVLIAFAVATIGFTAIKYGAADGALDMVGVSPLSFATAIGAFLFGIGMVIAGGCASGTLMRVGEGFTMQLLALVFFMIGSTLASASKPFWTEHFYDKGTKVFLPNVLDMGYFWAVVLQLLFIGVLYVGFEWYEKKKIGGEQ